MLLSLATKRVIPRRYAGTRNRERAEGFGREIIARWPDLDVESITTDMLAEYALDLSNKGQAITTINCKLSFVSVLFNEFKRDLRDPLDANRPFAAPEIPWRKEKHQVKWWLTPEMEPRVVAWCIEHRFHELADFITFGTHTGCRVEEALRLQRHHFDFERNDMTIPGTKTDTSQRTVPLMEEAVRIAKRRLMHAPSTAYLFRFSPNRTGRDEDGFIEISYSRITKQWHKVKVAFGWKQDSTATLKAIRRTFARRANDRGMPTELLRDYLGHGDIETTVGYLRLVGGHNREAMRGFLS